MNEEPKASHPQLSGNPPAWAKKLSDEFNEKYLRTMPKRFHVRRGVYRFQTHEEADIWWDKVIAESLAIEAKSASPQEE